MRVANLLSSDLPSGQPKINDPNDQDRTINIPDMVPQGTPAVSHKVPWGRVIENQYEVEVQTTSTTMADEIDSFSDPSSLRNGSTTSPGEDSTLLCNDRQVTEVPLLGYPRPIGGRCSLKLPNSAELTEAIDHVFESNQVNVTESAQRERRGFWRRSDAIRRSRRGRPEDSRATVEEGDGGLESHYH